MSKRILVMEDEEDNRQIIRDMLAGIDCEITEAEDGEQALAAIANERPDLILMGIHLPMQVGWIGPSRGATGPKSSSIGAKSIANRKIKNDG
jgi:two-component system cell cycle response regulator DivK